MLNRLTKSAEAQARLDEEYFKINMEGHQMRLKLENTLKNCHQVGKEASPGFFALFFSRRFLYLRNEPSGKEVLKEERGAQCFGMKSILMHILLFQILPCHFNMNDCLLSDFPEQTNVQHWCHLHSQ